MECIFRSVNNHPFDVEHFFCGNVNFYAKKMIKNVFDIFPCLRFK